MQQKTVNMCLFITELFCSRKIDKGVLFVNLKYFLQIDPSGPLATLRNLLMSSEGVALLKKWIAEKWWSMLLLFLGAAITVVSH